MRQPFLVRVEGRDVALLQLCKTSPWQKERLGEISWFLVLFCFFPKETALTNRVPQRRTPPLRNRCPNPRLLGRGAEPGIRTWLRTWLPLGKENTTASWARGRMKDADRFPPVGCHDKLLYFSTKTSQEAKSPGSEGLRIFFYQNPLSLYLTSSNKQPG